MIDLQEMVTKTLVANDNSRARSQQVAIGPSAIGGCQRRLWHDIAQTEPTNVGDKLGAILGTFIHTGIEDAIRSQDPFGVQYELEIAVEANGVPGHVDCYDKINHTVIDWKTIKKAVAVILVATTGNKCGRYIFTVICLLKMVTLSKM